MLEQKNIKDALDLILNVFMEYDAPDYSEQGIYEFKKFITYENVIGKFINKEMIFWGCFINDELAGVIATRNSSHICSLFVKKEFQRLGIAKSLFYTIVDECSINNINEITVNSSPYAIKVYHHLGFIDKDSEQTIDGIIFTPMKYTIRNEEK